MNPRDAALVAAVLVLGGIAVADGLRSDASTTVERTESERSATETTAARRIFPDLPVAGDLAITSGDDCSLRDFSVASGLEYPLPPIATTCALWAAPVGNRLAYATGSANLAPTAPIRFLDVGRPLLDLGRFDATGDVVWSADGLRAAWCLSGKTGREYVVGDFDTESGRRSVRPLAFCPRAFDPAGRLAATTGRRLLVGGRTLLVAPLPIDLVRWGRDGSIGLLLAGRRIERRVGGRLTHAVDLPGPFRYSPRVLLSPDNCAAVLIRRNRVHLVDVGCFRGRDSFTNISPDNCLNRRQVDISQCARFPAPRSFGGISAAWSPDGEWIAVSELDAIAFHRVVGRYEVVRWEASANSLAWR